MISPLKSGVKTCVATGCKEKTRDADAFCEEHWRELPRELRQEVVQLRARVQKFKPGLQGKAMAKYLDAVRSAVLWQFNHKPRVTTDG